MGDGAYSYSLTTFSRSGKLLQIEYALNAVATGRKGLGDVFTEEFAAGAGVRCKTDPPTHAVCLVKNSCFGNLATNAERHQGNRCSIVLPAPPATWPAKWQLCLQDSA